MTINLWAVLGAAVVNMILGSLWYGPLFGKMWMRMSGMSKEKIKSMPMSPARGMTIGFISALLIAYALALFSQYWAALSVGDAFVFAFWVWIGFWVPNTVSAVLWEGRSWKLFWLNVVFQLLSLWAMTSILVLWQ